MKNSEIAGLFYKIADMLEIQGIQWKPRAYRSAASAIEAMPRQLKEVYSKEGLKGLDRVPGVGKAIAKKIEELLKTGKLGYFEKLKREMPISFGLLDAVPGLGPKKLKALHSGLGISTKADLRKAAEKHEVSKLAGFAEKTEQEISRALGGKQAMSGRIAFGKALPVARKLVAYVKRVKGVKRAEIAGSFRRKKPTIGDIDILVASEKPKAVMKAILSFPSVKKVLASGEKKTSIVLGNGLQVDFRVVKEGQWGSALQYFTGSKAHSIALRKIAIRKGLKLSEYGVFKGEKAVACRSEKGVYNALGLAYIKPELRENEGEIEKAKREFAGRKK